jgi:hypothetical protein
MMAIYHWACLGLLAGSSRTKDGQFPSYFNEVRLICSQQVHLNPSNLQPFFFSVRELSVSFKQGDGDEKGTKMFSLQG